MADHLVLSRGDTGERVEYLQRLLERDFADTMMITPTPNGSFDDDTDNAVRAFQAKYGLDSDGIVGPRTWEVIAQVDPANWEPGSDNNPLEMAPVLVSHEDPADARLDGNEWSDRQQLTASYLEQTSNWETWPLVPVANSQFAGQVGYPLDAFEWDAAYGYETEVTERWLTVLDGLKEHAATELERVVAIVQNGAEQTRAVWADTNDGVLAWLAERLGGAREPPSRLIELALSDLQDCRAELTAGKLRTAAYSLERAMRAHKWVYDAWDAYYNDRTKGIERLELGREVLMDAAETVLIAAATGGAGEVWSLAGAARTAVATVAVKATVDTADQLVEFFAGARESIELTKILKDALVEGAASFAGQLLPHFLEGSRLADQLVIPFRGAISLGTLDSAVADRIARRLLGDSAQLLVEAALTTSTDYLAEKEYRGSGQFAEELAHAFVHGAFLKMVEHSTEHLRGLEVQRREDAELSELVAQLHAATR